MEQLICVVELRGAFPADAHEKLDAAMAGIGFAREMPGYGRRGAELSQTLFQLPPGVYWAPRTLPVFKNRPILIATLDTLGMEYRVIEMTATYWRGVWRAVGANSAPIPAVCNISPLP